MTDIVEVADGQLIEPPLTVEQRLAEHCAYAEQTFTNGDYFHLLAKDAAALIASQARRIAELEAVYAAARGLCYGEDWNNGTHAESRGYRKNLVAAVNAIEPLPALLNRTGEG